MFNRILVAFDGSDRSRRALQTGVELAAKFGHPLRAVTVIEGIPDYVSVSAYVPVDPSLINLVVQQQEAFTEHLLSEARSIAADGGVELLAEAIAGDEVEAIVEAVIRYKCDLLIVGLRSHPGLLDRLLSHTVQTLTEKAPCSVLGVR